MNTGQVLLVIFAFVFLSTVMLNFNQTTAMGTNSVDYAQRGILLTTVSTSYSEIIRGLAYDENTDTSYVPADQLNLLTPASRLGSEKAIEDTIRWMNDVDDFNGKTFDKTIAGTQRTFRTTFKVYYVNSTDPSVYVASPTLVKRVDMKTWQISPVISTPMPGDTLNSYILVGYFHFN